MKASNNGIFLGNLTLYNYFSQPRLHYRLIKSCGFTGRESNDIILKIYKKKTMPDESCTVRPGGIY